MAAQASKRQPCNWTGFHVAFLFILLTDSEGGTESKFMSGDFQSGSLCVALKAVAFHLSFLLPSALIPDLCPFFFQVQSNIRNAWSRACTVYTVEDNEIENQCSSAVAELQNAEK